jgi:hypothetical protein
MTLVVALLFRFLFALLWGLVLSSTYGYIQYSLFPLKRPSRSPVPSAASGFLKYLRCTLRARRYYLLDILMQFSLCPAGE